MGRITTNKEILGGKPIIKGTRCRSNLSLNSLLLALLMMKYYGIIYMRLKNLKVSNIFNVIEKLLVVDKDILEGSLIVAEDTRIRKYFLHY
ncbi:MAG: hypothetical protein U0586_03480 [Candidatus Brocadiaceae bacterium]